MTTQQPSFLAADNTSGQVIDVVAQGAKAGLQASESWLKGLDAVQKTTAETNFKSGMLDIMQRAENDPDVNSSGKYLQELESLRAKSMTGIQNKSVEAETLQEFNFESHKAQIQIENFFKKKVISAGQAATLQQLDMEAKLATPDSQNNIKKLLQRQTEAGIVSPKEAYELEKKTVKDMKQNSFLRDLNSGSQFAGEQLKSNAYGFDVTEMEKAKSILDRYEKRENEVQKEVQFNSAVDAGVALVNNNLDQGALQQMVLNGQMDAELAGAFELALFSPKKHWKEFEKGKANQPKIAAEYMIKAVEGMAEFDPDKASNIMKQALNEYSAPNAKINEKDLAWIIKAIDEKRKAPDNPIWSKLTSAVKMMPTTLGAGAMSKFMQTWDFKEDPRPVMKQAVVDQQKEDNPVLANYDIGTVIKRKSGSYEVVGWNEDGKPVFKKK